MKYRNRLILLIGMANSLCAGGQSRLTLSAAIDSALYNNLGLLISRNEAKIAGNNATRANAGMLPKLDLNAGTGYASNNLKQKLSTGIEINKNGVSNESYNSQLVLNWTLFDGTRMFASYEKLKVLKETGELNVQLKTEGIILGIINGYSNLVRQKIVLRGMQKNLSLYQERLRLAETRVRIGKSSRSEFLQASLDLNVQNSNLMRQQTEVTKAEQDLNLLMMRKSKAAYEVEDSLGWDKNIELNRVLGEVENSNRLLQELRLKEKQKEHEIQEQQSFAYPKLNFSAGYNINGSSSSQGLFLLNQSRGPQVGLTFNWNLYNGIQRKQVENTRLQQENVRLQFDETLAMIRTAVTNAWQRYSDAMAIAKTEQQNFRFAEENLQITMKRFQLEEATLLELKDAQQVNEACLTRLANTLFDVKTAETELLYLSGKLIK